MGTAGAVVESPKALWEGIELVPLRCTSPQICSQQGQPTTGRDRPRTNMWSWVASEQFYQVTPRIQSKKSVSRCMPTRLMATLEAVLATLTPSTRGSPTLSLSRDTSLAGVVSAITAGGKAGPVMRPRTGPGHVSAEGMVSWPGWGSRDSHTRTMLGSEHPVQSSLRPAWCPLWRGRRLWRAVGRTSRRQGGRAEGWHPARPPGGRNSSSGGSR